MKNLRTIGMSLLAYGAASLLLASPSLAADPMISMGGNFSCALQANGIAKCWGNNSFGELGRSVPRRGSKVISNPVAIRFGSQLLSLDAGRNHVCGIATSRAAFCVGLNRYGQLGQAARAGTRKPSPRASRVKLGGKAIAISAGGNHTCAILDGGNLECFGFNRHGQTGRRAKADVQWKPRRVNLGAPAVSVSAGSNHTCAVLVDGGLKCFGRNDVGQLGSETNLETDRPTSSPQLVPLPAATKVVVASAWHTCALLVDGRVFCFGLNDHGQLGNLTNADTAASNSTPLQVELGAAAVSITAGGPSSCAVLVNAVAKCFGDNADGQLANPTGNSSNDANPLPLDTAFGPDLRMLSAGHFHTCALNGLGTVSCAGNNWTGQLGPGAPRRDIPMPSPVVVPKLQMTG